MTACSSFRLSAPFHSMSVRRKQLSDVPQAEGSEKGIHQRMHENVGIAVALEPEPFGMIHEPHPPGSGADREPGGACRNHCRFEAASPLEVTLNRHHRAHSAPTIASATSGPQPSGS